MALAELFYLSTPFNPSQFFRSHQSTPTMADLDLQAIHDEMVSVAYDAGAMMLAANPGDIDTGTKLNCEKLPVQA